MGEEEVETASSIRFHEEVMNELLPLLEELAEVARAPAVYHVARQRTQPSQGWGVTSSHLLTLFLLTTCHKLRLDGGSCYYRSKDE